MPSMPGAAGRRRDELTARDRDLVVDLVRSAAALTGFPAGRAEDVTSLSRARGLLAEAWSAALDAMAGAVSGPGSARAGEIVELLRRIKELDALQRQEVALRDGVFDRVREALCSLADIDSTPTLISRTPAAVCALGFDRAIISRIRDATWLPEHVVERDDGWAADILAAGQATPMPLTPTLPETEMLRRRVSLLVDDVQRREAVHKPIADASLSRSYAASPIVCAGQVVGFLHGDCHYYERELDGLDR